MNFSKIYRFILVFNLVTPVFSQGTEVHDFLKFHVLDRETEAPLVYATVIFSSSGIGVITDGDGQFRVPWVYKAAKDTLSISSMGYETLFIPLEMYGSNGIHKLYASPKIESLDEIELFAGRKRKKWSPGKIVEEAIQRIPQNYPVNPHSYIAYFRDYQKLNDKDRGPYHKTDNTNYLNLNEGIIQVYDAGFGTDQLKNDLNQTVLFKYEKNDRFPKDRNLSIPYDNFRRKYLEGVNISPLGGNELNLINLANAIRNYNRMSFSFADVFGKNFLKNHFFSLKGVQYLENEPFYIIDFSSNHTKVTPKYRAHGNIVVSTIDFGIQHLDYSMINDYENRKLYSISIEYKSRGDLYYLNYITFNNYFESRDVADFTVEKVSYLESDKSFLFYFNQDVDPESLGKSHRKFKISIHGKPLDVTDAVLISPKVVKVSVKPFNSNFYRIPKEQFYFEADKVKDISGRLVNERKLVQADQFRELFVQQIRPDATLDSTFEFVDKSRPLKASRINDFMGPEVFWINSPLKGNK